MSQKSASSRKRTMWYNEETKLRGTTTATQLTPHEPPHLSSQTRSFERPQPPERYKRTQGSLATRVYSPEFTRLAEPMNREDTRLSPPDQQPFIINSSPATKFGMKAGWFLRYAARELGYRILPDGYVRVSDIMGYDWFRNRKITFHEFKEFVENDPMQRFEMVLRPDMVDGVLEDVWSVRVKYGHTIPGVRHSTKRITRADRLNMVVYKTHVADWENIRLHGIREGPDDSLIHLSQKPGSDIFFYGVPRHGKVLCITIDAEKAAKSGVKFFHTDDVELIATGGHNGAIPLEAIKSAVELEVTRSTLKPSSPT
ncbi:KptA family-domain-containing protein [Crassisporium funariophilum]|nr:KptA family-domain-containing protein [Crassisporium funariophilum]